MKILKYGMVLISCGIILVLVYHHFIEITPEDKVKHVLMNFDETKALSTEQKHKINVLINQPESYGLPKLKITEDVEVFLQPHLQQITLYKSTLNPIIKENIHVFVSFDVFQYERKEAIKNNHYIHIGNFTGGVQFVLKDLGFNKWKITNVKTTPFKPASDNGHWSGAYN